MDPIMRALRERCPTEVLDYGFVMQFLHSYSSPRAKLSRLVNSGSLVRLKKGLYIFGEPFRRQDIPIEMIANMIYGPSYVSLEWALRYYGLIPERVDEITSVTFKRKKRFNTIIGRFSYEHCDPNVYPLGLTLLKASPFNNALIASKEKALVDQLVIRRGKVTSTKEMEQILFEDLRMVENDIERIDLTTIKAINSILPHSATSQLIAVIKRLKSE